MPETDITTLAIEIQSRDAEKNLQTFHELLQSTGELAGGIRPCKLEIDAAKAIEQLRAVKGEYGELAAARNSIADLAKVETGGIGIDTASGQEFGRLVEGFEESRKQAQALQEEIRKTIESIGRIDDVSPRIDAAAVSTARAGSVVEAGSVATREYAQTVRELAAAKKEYEKASTRADADGEAINAADERAVQLAKELAGAQRELQTVTKALAKTHQTYSGDILGLTEKKDALKTRVVKLREEYAATQKEVKKLSEKLDESASAADVARAKYKGLEEKLAGLPPPVEKTRAGMTKLNPQITRMTRGMSGLMTMAGNSIPGLYGVGQAVSMFTMATGPAGIAVGVAAAAIAASVGIYKTYSGVLADSAKMSYELADRSAKNVETFRKQTDANQNALTRLRELNAYDALYDSQKNESRQLVERLTAAYKGLGLVYDVVTGKVQGLSGAQNILAEQDRKTLKTKSWDQYKDAAKASRKARDEAAQSAVSTWRKIWEGALLGDSSNPTGSTDREAKAFADSLAGLKIEEQVERLKNRIGELEALTDKGGGAAWAQEASHQLPAWKKALEFAEKELEAKKKIDELDKPFFDPALNRKLEETDRHYVRDASGDLLRIKTEEEIAAFREKEIAAQREIVTLAKAETAARREATQEEIALWGKRLDGTQKQSGWRGILSDGIGGVMTEVSVGVEIDDKEVEIPLIIPDSTTSDLARIAKVALGEAVPDDLLDKAVAFARKRLEEGKSPFFNGEQDDQAFRRIKTTTKEMVEAEIELSRLQKERLQYEERRKREIVQLQKSLADSEKRYVRDSSGELIRSKTEAEIAEAREREIETQRKIRDLAKEGSKERLQAEIELDRLQKERLQYEEQKHQQFTQELERMTGSLTRLRETSQTAIRANSSEGIRMQSRATLNGINYQKTSAENSGKIVGSLGSFQGIVDSLKNATENILSAVENLGTGTV